MDDASLLRLGELAQLGELVFGVLLAIPLADARVKGDSRVSILFPKRCPQARVLTKKSVSRKL
jgi:hypothetical protein